jgi:hypothetical protein
MFNEGIQIHNFMSSSGSGTVINYGSGSDFLTSDGSGSGSTSQKVTVPTVPVPVPQHCPRDTLSYGKEVTIRTTGEKAQRVSTQCFFPKKFNTLFIYIEIYDTYDAGEKDVNWHCCNKSEKILNPQPDLNLDRHRSGKSYPDPRIRTSD